MLTHLRIQNFKAWQDTGPVRLAPLTVIFGANSAGKSSLGHLMLALKQTAASSDRKRPLHLGDSNSLIDLGTFEDCLYQHEKRATLSFELGWTLPKILSVRDPIHDTDFSGDALRLATSLREINGHPTVTTLEYALEKMQLAQLKVHYRRAETGKDAGKYDLTSEQYSLVRNPGRPWKLQPPVKFYGFPDEANAYYQNTGFLSDFALATESLLRDLYYLGPLRDPPRRVYPWAGDEPADVGQRGEQSIAALLSAGTRSLSRGKGRRSQLFPAFVAQWLKELGLIHSFDVKQVARGRKEYEALVRTHATASEVKITDVGFGISQIFPALVQAFYAPAHSVVWMEQPEIHLHPSVQAGLADVFIGAVQARENGQDRGVQLIVESHSEHFLNRLQRRVAEGVITTEQVAVYFVRRTVGGAELEPLELNLYGDILNWPENFFGDEMADIAARTKAAMDQRIRDRQKMTGHG